MITTEKPLAKRKGRETLIQVEPKLGQVLLGLRDTSAFARGNCFEVIAFSPEDAIALAQQLACAAELIMNMQKDMLDGTDITNGKLPGNDEKAPT